MANIKSFTSAGVAAADIVIDDAVLTLDKGAQALKDAVTAIRNAMRAGTACTKGKGEVAGSNKKPWKQKGTGNARAGFRQSPVWRGGGVAHGPKPRDFGQKVNKKVMALAFKRALSEKINSGDVIVVSEFKFEAPKTKLMAALLKSLGVTRSALIIQKEVDDTTLLVTSNLPRVDYSTAQALDVYTLMVNKTIVCDQAGYDALVARIAK
jgi:large subunit ribosomal protein L4